MRIAVIPSWYPTADVPFAGSFVRSAALALSAAGHTVTVLFPELRSLREWRPGAGSGEMLEEETDGLRVWRWRGFRWWPRERHGSIAFASAARRLFLDFVAQHDVPDLVHAHVVLPAGYAAYRILAVWDVPFVLTEHAGPFSMMTETPWQRWQTRHVWNSSAAITAVSESLGRQMKSEGLDRDPIVIPNTLDPLFTDAPPAPRRAADTRFLTIASLLPGKGIDDAIVAFARVAKSVPDATLTIAGDGPLRGELATLAADLGIADRVHFPGRLAGPRAVRAALAASDGLIFPSHAETFGVAIIEALACGRPVVATRCGGPESIVSDADGILVKTGDAHALADAMRQIAAIHDRYDPVDLAQRCLTRFGPATVASQYERVFREVIERHQRDSETAKPCAE